MIVPEKGKKLSSRVSCARIGTRESEAMTGIQFITDDKRRKTAVLIDLKKHARLWEDFWDGLVSESRRKEKSIPYQQYRANRMKHGRPRG
jgi:CTP:phosphocholine cytidylyltransferase-like protein